MQKYIHGTIEFPWTWKHLYNQIEEGNIIHTAEWALINGDIKSAYITDNISNYLLLKARWYTLERLYRLSVMIFRRLAETDPDAHIPYVAMTLNNMGALLKNMGKL